MDLTDANILLCDLAAGCLSLFTLQGASSGAFMIVPFALYVLYSTETYSLPVQSC